MTKKRKGKRVASVSVRSCPFCGLMPTVRKWYGGDTGHEKAVQCDNEYCAAMPTVSGTTKAKAIAKWNTRA